MNKYYLLTGALVILVLSGIGYQKFYGAGSICTRETARPVTVDMVTQKDSWTFSPNPINVKHCDDVTLKIYNEDDYDHGFAVDSFGINARLQPKMTTEIKFFASQIGTFPFYCSVPCGEGHYNQKGEIIVK